MKNFRSLWQPNFVCLGGRKRYSQCLEANQEKSSTESSTGIFAAASSNTVLENICHFRLPVGLESVMCKGHFH